MCLESGVFLLPLLFSQCHVDNRQSLWKVVVGSHPIGSYP